MIITTIALISIIVNGLLVFYVLNGNFNNKERDELFSQKSRLEGINEEKDKQISELLSKNNQLNEVLKNNKVLE